MPPPDPAFPSGHAMISFVVYGSLAIVAWHLGGRRAGLLAVAAATLLLIAIGASRIYLGVHWLTDVVGGYIAAATWLVALAALIAAGRALVARGS